MPIVATGDILYHARQRRRLQDVATCIRLGVTIERAGFLKERHADRFLKAPQETARLFAPSPRRWPAPERSRIPAASRSTTSPTNIPQNPGPTAERAERLELLTWAGPSGAIRTACRRRWRANSFTNSG